MVGAIDADDQAELTGPARLDSGEGILVDGGVVGQRVQQPRCT